MPRMGKSIDRKYVSYLGPDVAKNKCRKVCGSFGGGDGGSVIKMFSN